MIETAEVFIIKLIIQLIQPLIPNFSETIFNVSIFSAFIGATGSILGGIIGGIITGYVAFEIARYQLNKDSMAKHKDLIQQHEHYKKLLVSEINMNNLFLDKIHKEISSEDLQSILKFSISNRIYTKIISELTLDEYYEFVERYYRVLYRIQNDTSLHSEDTYDILQKEINFLKTTTMKIKQLMRFPTSQ